MTCCGDIRDDFRTRSASGSDSCVRLRFLRTLAFRVNGLMPPFGLGAGGAEVGVPELMGGSDDCVTSSCCIGGGGGKAASCGGCCCWIRSGYCCNPG